MNVFPVIFVRRIIGDMSS